MSDADYSARRIKSGQPVSYDGKAYKVLGTTKKGKQDRYVCELEDDATGETLTVTVAGGYTFLPR